VKRRNFLTAGTGLVLMACANPQSTIKINMLKGSIPSQIISDFTRLGNPSFAIDVQMMEQLSDGLEQLSRRVPPESDWWSWVPGRRSSKIPDLLTLGHYWLDQAIQSNLIQPLPVDDLATWQQLPQQWQRLVDSTGYDNPPRPVNSQSVIWGAPYRWGTTVIAYRRDLFQNLGWFPQDWADLWRPELRQRISLLDHSREVVGLTLKKLGKSYNEGDITKIQELKPQLQSLNQQVKFYSSDSYLQPLLLKDTWLAVGWSNDVLPIVKRDRQIGVVVPASGTALWADLWVRPSGLPPLPVGAKSWINFCWELSTANRISLLANGVSPILSGLKPEQILEDIRNQPALLPSGEILDRSEVIRPLVNEWQYQALWQEIRQRV
jgi:putative spermidine/putrescine transport system substrate-binding protein